MVLTKASILDEKLYSKELTADYPQPNIIYNQSPIVTLSSKEVAWLFGTDVSAVEEWVVAGILTPCSTAPDGSKRFWREDIAGLLAICGA